MKQLIGRGFIKVAYNIVDKIIDLVNIKPTATIDIVRKAMVGSL